ncbi:MAG: hypothetical protein HOA49_06085 [Flavobacteriales bacterium]|jgi:hypothetical protein|nr:hypothetical protein [Flavobacteriales bacterium]MBT6815957.1 hypothetical protein [Flavobacteriales bacterium]
MKKLINRTLLFLTISAIFSLLLGFLSVVITNKTFNFEFKKYQNILIVGNSHTECSISDKILSNSVNISQSASSYFYSYIKVREFVKRNPTIDTVIISFSDNDLFSEKEKWLSSTEKIRNKMTRMIFLFNTEDYLTLFCSNPITTSLQSFIVYSDFYNLYIHRRSFIGGYNQFNKNKIKESILEFNQDTPKIDYKIAHTELKYLLKIYELCEKEGVHLILLNSPVHPVLQSHFSLIKDRNYKIASEKMTNATFLDHSSYKLDNSMFADLSHLNGTGSISYSLFLKSVFSK